MMAKQVESASANLTGMGSYTVPEAACLLKTSQQNIHRWLGGYTYRKAGKLQHIPPLWKSQHDGLSDDLELGFRDLIELRFVKAFREAGMGLLAIRNCLEYARECVEDAYPFTTRRFQTDGRTIFLESIKTQEISELLDLKRRQYVFKQIIENTFKDLDIEDEIVTRWRPFNGKTSIVIDPQRAFGQPIVSQFGIPTTTLADAVESEGGTANVAAIYEVSEAVVRDAVKFENELRAFRQAA